MNQLQSSKEVREDIVKNLMILTEANDIKIVNAALELDYLFNYLIQINQNNLKACEKTLELERIKPYKELESCLEDVKITHNGKTESFNYWFNQKYPRLEENAIIFDNLVRSLKRKTNGMDKSWKYR